MTTSAPRQTANRAPRRLTARRRLVAQALRDAGRTIGAVELFDSTTDIDDAEVDVFLYIGASDLLPEAREHDSPWPAAATVVGMALLWGVTRFV